MLLSYVELVDIVKAGIIENVPEDNINGSSIDLNLGNEILVEAEPELVCPHCQSNRHGALGNGTEKVSIQHITGVYDKLYCCDCFRTSSTWQWIPVVDPAKKESLKMKTVDISETPYVLMPGHTCLAHTTQVFHLPSWLSAEFKLKSSQARLFLEHLNAGWADPRWHGSVLTLEFVNLNRFHAIKLTAGEKCGQIVFFKNTPVPENKSYAVRGQYNKDSSVSASKGVR